SPLSQSFSSLAPSARRSDFLSSSANATSGTSASSTTNRVMGALSECESGRCLRLEALQFGDLLLGRLAAAGLAAQFGEAAGAAHGLVGALVGLVGAFVGLLTEALLSQALGLEFGQSEGAPAVRVIDDHFLAGQVEAYLHPRADEAVVR